MKWGRSPVPHAAPDGSILGSHAYLEALIAASGAEYTFLRSSGMAANTLAWAEQIRRSDVLRWFHRYARRALVHEADLAAVGVRALVEDEHNHGGYHLTGPQHLTQIEQLAAIGAALGRTLRFEEIDPSVARAGVRPCHSRDGPTIMSTTSEPPPCTERPAGGTGNRGRRAAVGER